jgi:hypothetical protein
VLKTKIQQLFGAPRFASNLKHLGLWDNLIEDCRVKAVALDESTRQCFVDKNLGKALGEDVVPNTFGKIEMREDGLRSVALCGQDEGAQTQAAAMPTEFPQNPVYSQLWNETCFIHCIRMIAMAVDALFQTLASGVCQKSNGAFTGCAIKGFVPTQFKATQLVVAIAVWAT